MIIIIISTSDARETSFLFQRKYVTLQRFNAVCVSDIFRDIKLMSVASLLMHARIILCDIIIKHV